MANGNPFLALAEQGRSSRSLYVLGAFLVAVAFLVGTAMTVGAAGATEDEAALGPTGLALSLASFGWLLLATLAVVAWMHGRPVGTLFAPPGQFRWSRVFAGAAVWLVLFTAATCVEAVLFPGNVRRNEQFGAEAALLAAGLLLIPLQTTAEEVFFRGYLLQASYRWTRKPLLLCALSGLLFLLPHLGNIEASHGWAAWTQWAVMGAFLAALTLRTRSLDLAIGVHAANNLAAFLLVGTKEASLPAVSLFVSESPNLALQNASLVAAATIAYLVLASRPTAEPR